MPNKSQRHQKQILILEKTLKAEKLNKNEYIRIQAVLLNLKGFTHKQIAKISLKSTDTLEKWITNFNKQGIHGLRNKPISKPRNYKLTNAQKNEIKKIIKNGNPSDSGLKGEFWHPNNLKQLIKKQFNVIYKSSESYRKLLKYCGFTYQKVEYKDSREDKAYKEDMRLRLKKKLKKGVLKMYW